MDVERALVCRMARTQSMEAVLKRTLEPHHFVQRKKGNDSPEPMPGEVYAWMLSHTRRFKTVPSETLTRERFPRFEFVEVSDPVESILEEMVKHVNRMRLIDGIRELSAIADDPERVGEAEVHVFDVATQLARELPSSSVTRLSDSLSRLELYNERERTGETPGVSLVFPELDALTYGVQPHELMIWNGFLGTGKSSISLMQCAKAYLERDHTPLFISLEMEGDKLASKWDSMMAGFSYKAMKHLKLDGVDKAKWEAFGEKAEGSRFEKDILVISDIYRCTVDRVFAEVQRWKPDLTVVDTMDEVRGPAHLRSKWEQEAWAVRELKGVARATKSPIVACAQAGRSAHEEGATIGNIAGTIDIARKADIVIGLHQTQEAERGKMMTLRVLKTRDSDGKNAEYSVYWDIETMTFRSWTPEDRIPPPPDRART